MRVKIVQSIAGPHRGNVRAFDAGTCVEVDDATGKAWIASGVAKALDAPPEDKTLKGAEVKAGAGSGDADGREGVPAKPRPRRRKGK